MPGEAGSDTVRPVFQHVVKEALFDESAVAAKGVYDSEGEGHRGGGPLLVMR